MFADDTAILTQNRRPEFVYRDLQEAVNELFEWFIRWKIKINPQKTQAMIFTRRRGVMIDNIEIDEHEIPWSNLVKYLGLEMDKQLTWRSHIEKTLNKVRGKMKKLYPLTNRKSKMSLKNKLTLIKTIMRPALMYGSTA